MLRRIAVHLDQGSNAAPRFDLALSLAREFKAELQCIYAGYIPAGYWSGYVYGDYLMMAEVLEELRKITQADRDKAEAQFVSAAAKQGIKTSWFSAEQAPAEELAAHARLSDLLILSREDKEDTKAMSGDGFSEHVVFSVGRPVLVLPPKFGQAMIGQRILLCWDGSREAARALADAAPFLQVAGEIMTLTVQEDKSSARSMAAPLDELKTYCRAHSYDISKHIHRDRDQQSIGDVILSVLAEEKIDLIVMGAYGHSRLREWILGGATQTLLKASPVPVLLSH